MSHADSAENAEAMRGSLYVMETFAERAHSACAYRPDGSIRAKQCMPLRILPQQHCSILHSFCVNLRSLREKIITLIY